MRKVTFLFDVRSGAIVIELPVQLTIKDPHRPLNPSVGGRAHLLDGLILQNLSYFYLYFQSMFF